MTDVILILRENLWKVMESSVFPASRLISASPPSLFLTPIYLQAGNYSWQKANPCLAGLLAVPAIVEHALVMLRVLDVVFISSPTFGGEKAHFSLHVSWFIQVCLWSYMVNIEVTFRERPRSCKRDLCKAEAL